MFNWGHTRSDARALQKLKLGGTQSAGVKGFYSPPFSILFQHRLKSDVSDTEHKILTEKICDINPPPCPGNYWTFSGSPKAEIN